MAYQQAGCASAYASRLRFRGDSPKPLAVNTLCHTTIEFIEEVAHCRILSSYN
jgi:hypothetical protein